MSEATDKLGNQITRLEQRQVDLEAKLEKTPQYVTDKDGFIKHDFLGQPITNPEWTKIKEDIADGKKVTDDLYNDLKILSRNEYSPQKANPPPISEAELADKSKVTTNQSVGVDKVITPIGESAYPNILHKYASYTYNLSLHVIPIKQYNEFSTTQKSGYKPEKGNVLIASAGRWDNTAIRNENFKNADFFFDKMSFETVIGATTYTQNSNALTIDFTIIEPYGMTLINRFIDLSKSNFVNPENKKSNDNVMQLPFLLQIDFFGYGSDGKPIQIHDISKYIPIMITGIKFKISAAGAEYNISAVPYNHQAFTDTNGSTPIKVQVTANSLREFFATDKTHGEVEQKDIIAQTGISNKKEVDTVNAANLREQKTAEKIDAAAGTRTATDEYKKSGRKKTVQIIPTRDAKGNVISQKSYPEAVNLWHKVNLSLGVCEIPDEIAFTLADEFINAIFQTKDLLNITSLAMEDARKIDGGNNALTKLIDQNGIITNIDDKEHPKVITTVNQGTSILNVINTAMLNSSYIHDQIIDPQDSTGKITVGKLKEILYTPLNWYKVVPTVEILGYDNKTNRYPKRTTYHIQHCELHQDKNRGANQGKPVVIAKDYQYIFTGKNIDIIDFDLTYNSQFYVVNVANPSNSDATAASPSAETTPSQSWTDKENSVVLTSTEVEAILNNINDHGIPELRPRIHNVANIPTTSATRGGKAEMAKQLERNILSTIAGDLVTVKLKIVGDPDFIKQDDVFFGLKDITEKKYTNAGNKVVTDKRKTPNGSLATDTADLFVRLTYKTAVDYDKNGLAIPVPIDNAENKYGSSIFSGIYKITTVKNYFSGGKFEQELELYHYNLQPTPGISTGPDKSQREDAKNAPKSTAVSSIVGIPPKTLEATGSPAAKGVVTTPSGTTVTTPPPSASDIAAAQAAVSAAQEKADAANAAYNSAYDASAAAAKALNNAPFGPGHKAYSDAALAAGDAEGIAAGAAIQANKELAQAQAYLNSLQKRAG